MHWGFNLPGNDGETQAWGRAAVGQSVIYIVMKNGTLVQDRSLPPHPFDPTSWKIIDYGAFSVLWPLLQLFILQPPPPGWGFFVFEGAPG